MSPPTAQPEITRAIAEDPNALAAARAIAEKKAAHQGPTATEELEAQLPTSIQERPHTYLVKVVKASEVKAEKKEDHGDHQVYVTLKRGDKTFHTLKQNRGEDHEVTFNDEFTISVLDDLMHKKKHDEDKVHKTDAEKVAAHQDKKGGLHLPHFGKKHDDTADGQKFRYDTKLHIELYDKDTFGVDDALLGKATYDLAQITEGTQQVEVVLKHFAHRHDPKIHLEISIAPNPK